MKSSLKLLHKRTPTRILSYMTCHVHAYSIKSVMNNTMDSNGFEVPPLVFIFLMTAQLRGNLWNLNVTFNNQCFYNAEIENWKNIETEVLYQPKPKMSIVGYKSNGKDVEVMFFPMLTEQLKSGTFIPKCLSNVKVRTDDGGRCYFQFH